MATISVTGHVTRSFYENKGFEITEFFTMRDGQQGTRKYDAWFDAPQNLDGAVGTFTGLLSVKIDEWKNPDGSPKLNREGKPGQSVKIAINGATFTPGAENPVAVVKDVLGATLVENMPF